MNKNRSLVILVVVIALLAGVAYYMNRGNKEPVGTNSVTDIRSQLESLIKNPPAADATQSERLDYVTWLSDSASKVNTIDINKCVPEPLVIQVTPSTEVTFVNNDQFPHFIMFNPSFYFEVPAGSSKSVEVDLNDNPGIYPYRCDNTERVGVVVVKE